MAAIERAEKLYHRIPDWELLEEGARAEGLLDLYLEVTILEEPNINVNEIMNDLVLVDWAFHSLAIDSKGDPLPGQLPWSERAEQYYQALERGEGAGTGPGTHG